MKILRTQTILKRIPALLLGIFVFSYSFAQSPSKNPIDSTAYNNWETVEGPSISNDGKYIGYQISKTAYRTQKVIVTSADLKWKIELAGSANIHFTPDSKYLVYKDDGSDLVILKLGTFSKQVIPGVTDMRIIETGAGYLAYTKNDSGKALVFRNLATGREAKFPGAENFHVSGNGKLVVLRRATGAGAEFSIADPAAGTSSVIWQGKNPENLVFDKQGKQLLFSTDDKGRMAYWYYRTGMGKAAIIADNSHVPDSDVELGRIDHFSLDGSRVFISLKEKLGKPMDDPMTVNIWTYMDKKTQVAQLGGAVVGGPQGGPPGPVNFTGVLDIASKKIIRLQKATEDIADNCIQILDWGNDDWGQTIYAYDAPGVPSKIDRALVNTRDGSRKGISQAGTISPGGKYMVYYDREQKKIFSLRVSDGALFEISKNIRTEWDVSEPGYGGYSYARANIAGWLQNDRGILLYDQYDIWQVDPEGSKPPLNVTNGLGKKDQNILFLSDQDDIRRPFKGNETILLTAFNPKTKDDGFYRITLGESKDPEKLIMGPYAYSMTRNPFVYHGTEFTPIKARDAEAYIVRRQSATEAPNLFFTKDFKNFRQITNVRPQKAYNWYTTELHTFTNPDGTRLQGVLYKPEDFDPGKKYPVIFYYYAKLSDNLHSFLRPEPSDGRLNIPWYVSNGYLVFTPDISHPVFGEVFKGAQASIESAAKYVGSLPYVDPKKLGMQGISWGGIETNYFVTHTGLFAAACSASGLSDFFSQYNSVNHGEFSQWGYESGGQGPGKSLWEVPQWYLENSPVMSANKVTTPLLMFETTKDGACPFVNAFELFNALRRLGKKVWMLEYTEGDHGVWGRESMDFDIRMQQFFNHFLKDAPAPRWMTQGRPARFKNIEDRLELDTSSVQTNTK
jgi:dipeptidyl aminopeptidase/acylaminoacyl peptidase